MMLIDLNAASGFDQFKSDILIVGGGIAGLSLADALRGSGRQVDVLEAGGESFDSESQALFAAEMMSLPHLGTTAGRYRVYGGSSTRWGGQLLPLATQDFAARPHISQSGWPIDSTELLPFLSRCENLLGVNSEPYDRSLLEKLAQPLPLYIEKGIQLRFSKWAPFQYRNVAKSMGKRCQKDRFTRIFLNCSVTSIDLHADGQHVQGVQVQTLDGTSFSFSSRQVVIAAGTIETIRILLSSRSVHKDGIGNHSDNLGRWFHDHLSVKAAVLQPVRSSDLLNLLAPWYLGSTRHTIKLETTAAWQEENSCLNVMGHIVFEAPDDSAFTWLRKQLQATQSGASHDHTIPHLDLMSLPAELVDTAYLAWKRLYYKRRWCPVNGSINLQIDTEQQPNPENRIRLSTDKDLLGMYKAIVQWNWGESERHAFAAYRQLFTQQWNHWDFGKLQWINNFEPGSDWERNVNDIYHMMGGTRMSDDPSQGVVDSNLCVHGVDNLFVASCSVFPTGGSSNPTLTLMALTLRLAEHLKSHSY